MRLFHDFIAIEARDKGIEQIRIRSYEDEIQDIDFPEDIYSVSMGNNAEFSQNFIRLDYESMITPETVFDYDLASKALTVRKMKEIPSGYDKTQYVTERKMAPSRDGVEVPISIVYKKNFKRVMWN